MPEILASTYEILQKIGAGGGGEVYLAYHQRLGKKVVLKATSAAFPRARICCGARPTF